MKKFLYVFLTIMLFSGCGMMNNTPTRKVEELLGKYQANDGDVLEDLDNVLLSDSSLSDDERNDYHDFMSKHYQDMTYKVKGEKIDGDAATVDVEVTVRDYSSALNKASEYRVKNASEFNDSNSFASYRLEKLKDVTDVKTYTIVFHLTKDDKEWKVDPLTGEDESKLNGTYGYNDVNSYNVIDNDSQIDDTDKPDSDVDTTDSNENSITNETRATDDENQD